GRVAQQIVGIAGAERADDHVVDSFGVLQNAQFTEAAGRDAQLAQRRPPLADKPALEVGIGPGARDDPAAVPRSAGFQRLPAPAQLILFDDTFSRQRAREHFYDPDISFHVGREQRDALIERAFVFAVREAEEIVIVAALDAPVFGHDVD